MITRRRKNTPVNEAYQQAEQKIQQALKSGATELDLRNMKLTELPESIGQLKQLRKLDVGGDSWKDEKTDHPARLAR
jgi:Leucine-rich repeat (LRR) protein